MKNNCGIYKITCLPTGKIYIGSAVNLLKRKQNHFEALANGVHKNIHLQNAYKKYGKSSFVFEVLEMVENKNNLLAREQFCIMKRQIQSYISEEDYSKLKLIAEKEGLLFATLIRQIILNYLKTKKL